jgi:hypothetical protein
MKATHVLTAVVLIGLMSAPAFAQDRRQRRAPDQRGQQSQDQGERSGARRTGQRAVPRDSVRPNDAQRQQEVRRQDQQVQRQQEVRRQDQQVQRQQEVRRQDQQAQRQYDARRNDQVRRDNDARRYDPPSRDRGRPYYPYYSNRGYGQRTIIVPRYVRPSIVTVVPYRPYRYRPSIGIGIYYGNGGAYPYGYTPRGYYDPIPGRPYGGLRITGASRYAQVFADGYYVGIVNDFDGIFQHVNLEAGPHRIEIVEAGYEAIEFDVMIQAGRTTTFRADRYGY